MSKIIKEDDSRLISFYSNKMWERLSNTDEMNRFIGLNQVVYDQGNYADGLYRMARMKIGPLTLEWKEYPFNWTRDQGYTVFRHFTSGPIEWVILGHALKQINENQTEIQMFAYASIKNEFMEAIARRLLLFVGNRCLDWMVKVCEKMQQPTLATNPFTRANGVTNESTLSELITQLKQYPVSEKLIQHLDLFVKYSTDSDLVRIQPYFVAERLNLDKREVLRLFLYATKVGIFNLSWELMCPSCRVPKAEKTSMRDIKVEVHCDTCQINYKMNFDRYIELRFTIHHSIRKTEEHIFCIGRPSQFRHALFQRYLDQRERQFEISIHLEDERFSLFVMNKGKRIECIPSLEGKSSFALSFPQLLDESAIFFKPGLVHFSLHLENNDPHLIMLEQEKWDEYATSAAEVSMLQEFRDLFSSEVLSPDTEVNVQNLAVMFTDLKGSTLMYEQMGDAKAYASVREHFTFLVTHIGQFEGVLVKTIGDAIMAVFLDVNEAVKAALFIQREFMREFGSKQDTPLILKIGIHCGPVIAINSNNLIDFFGRTVNIAARVQNESIGNDIILTEQILQYKTVKVLLAKQEKVTLESFSKKLKGIEGEMALTRICF
jgi:class 3 adenylate cyclase